MSNPEVTLNLPPIVNTGETFCTIPDINKECSISISTASTISLENEEDQSTINVVNSNDVIIGSVTQFHGPVTIVQQSQSQLSQESIEVKPSKAKLVTADYAPSSSKDSPACMSKRFLVLFTAVTAILSLLILTVIFTIQRNKYTRENEDKDSWDINNATTTAATTTIITGTSTTTANPNVDNTYTLLGHELYTVQQWGGRPPLWETPITPPINFVIISHTAGINCQSFRECSTQLRIIQGMHVTNGNPNIGYNFLIGGDGNVYEARGWSAQNFHRDSTIGISFMGNFVFDEPTDSMIDALRKLLELGIRLRVLPTTYQIVGHNQTMATLSPGQNIFRVIETFDNFYPGILPTLRQNL